MGCCCGKEAAGSAYIPPYDLFVVGGLHWDNDAALGSVELLSDSTEKKWDNLPSMTIRKYHLAAAVIDQPDGTVDLLAIGGKQPGLDGGDELKTVERLSIRRGGQGIVPSATWQSGVSMNRARWGHGAVGIRDMVFVFGGTSGDGDVNATLGEAFRASRRTWIEAAPLGTARVMLTTTISRNSEWVFAVGGHSVSAKRTGERYDVTSDRWLAPGFRLCFDRYFHASAWAANALFVFGGTGESSVEAERYDAREGSKSAKLMRMPQRRSHFAAVTLPNDNSIVLIGSQGRTADNVAGDIYDVRAGRYQKSVFPPLLLHRHGFACQLVD